MTSRGGLTGIDLVIVVRSDIQEKRTVKVPTSRARDRCGDGHMSAIITKETNPDIEVRKSPLADQM